MDKLRKLFKNKEKPLNTSLALMAALGVLLLILSSTVFRSTEKKDRLNQSPVTEIVENWQEPAGNSDTYESQLEQRLSQVLSQVEGVGKVDVMLKFSYSEEIIVAEDVSKTESSTTETDAQGGAREVVSQSVDSRVIMVTGSGGTQQPLILKEIEPKVEGVIIVAEGGDSVLIKEALIYSATTVLGVEPHKVQVLKMSVK